MIFVSTKFSGEKLISIGMIANNNARTFYAELTDTYNAAEIPAEELSALDAPVLPAEPDYSAIYAKMTLDQLREHLIEWLNKTTGPSRFWSKSPKHDDVFLTWLIGERWPRKVMKSFEDCNKHKSLNEDEAKALASKYRTGHTLDEAKLLMTTMKTVYQRSDKESAPLLR